MSKRKKRTVKIDLISKGEVLKYQYLIEATIGTALASLSIYNDNEDNLDEGALIESGL